MPLKNLTLEALREIDNGVPALMFDHEVRQVTRDCNERPALSKARKVTLEVEFVPQTNAQGVLTHIDHKFTCKSSSPAQVVEGIQSFPTPDHRPQVRVGSERDIQQGNIGELIDEDTGEVIDGDQNP